jgi:hypothetical protein
VTHWGHCFGPLPAALHKNDPDRFLARDVPGGDVKEFFRGLRLVTAELLDQGSAVCARLERRDGVSIADLGKFVTLSGETLDVVW